MRSLYLISCAVNGGVYVGVSVHPTKRWTQHRCASRAGVTPLYRSMRKHGIGLHTFEVIESHPTVEQASEAEVWWVRYLRALGARVFNLTDGGEGLLGYRPSDETRAKMSAARIGKRMSEEQRAKTAAINARRSSSPEGKAATSARFKGKSKSDEQRERMAASQQRRWRDPEAHARASAAHVGKVISPEQRRKLSEAMKGRTLSEEHRRKMSEAQTRRHARERSEK